MVWVHRGAQKKLFWRVDNKSTRHFRPRWRATTPSIRYRYLSNEFLGNDCPLARARVPSIIRILSANKYTKSLPKYTVFIVRNQEDCLFTLKRRKASLMLYRCRYNFKVSLAERRVLVRIQKYLANSTAFATAFKSGTYSSKILFSIFSDELVYNVDISSSFLLGIVAPHFS